MLLCVSLSLFYLAVLGKLVDESVEDLDAFIQLEGAFVLTEVSGELFTQHLQFDHVLVELRHFFLREL